MALYTKLPAGLPLGKKITLVGSVGAPGRGVGLGLHAYEGTQAWVRVLGFDSELSLVSDHRKDFEEAYYAPTPLNGAAWRDGQPALYLFGSFPIGCRVPEGAGEWLERATAALGDDPWLQSAREQLPGGSKKRMPKCGFFLGESWVIGDTYAAVRQRGHIDGIHRYRCEPPFERDLLTLASNDPAENERRFRLRPRLYTRLIALDAERIAFVGCNSSRSGGFDHKLGWYDVAADELAGIPSPHHAERLAVAHDGRGGLLIQDGAELYRYDRSLGPAETVSSSQAPMLTSWRLLGGNVQGDTLWLNPRSKALCLATADELAGGLSEGLTALAAGWKKR